MPGTIRPVRANHVNLVLEDFDDSLTHVRDVYGADVLTDIPQDDWHACLVDIGRVIFELFVPHDFFLSSRYGPHHLGVEFQAEMDQVRAALGERGIRIIRDLDVAVHAHPADCHGVALEFFGGHFHDNEELTGTVMQPASYWRDEHPLGLTGLHGLTLVTPELDSTARFFRDLLDGQTVSEGDRPELGGRAMSLQVADMVFEILAPTGPGPLQQHLERHGEGLRSTVFGVRDLEQARAHLSAHGIELVEGFAPSALSIPPEQNLGVTFEFIEHDG